VKRLAFIAFALLAAFLGARAQTIEEFLKAATVRWNTPTEPFRIIGNIHYVGTNGLAVYLVTSPQGHILIDTALPEATPQIRSSIAKLGVKVADIKYLLNTHAHLDHTGGFAELKKETDAQLIAGTADRPLLEGGYYPGQEHTVELRFPPVKVDRTVGDGDAVTLGDITIIAHATPGHSPGCTTWTMNVREGNEDHTAVFFCSATVALNTLVGNPTYPGIVDDYRRTFERVRDIKGDVFLGPHPEMYDMPGKRARMAHGASSPFVNAKDFPAYIETLKRDFEASLAKQTAAAQPK
jgi:metallo-beta-lactamase class B